MAKISAEAPLPFITKRCLNALISPTPRDLNSVGSRRKAPGRSAKTEAAAAAHIRQLTRGLYDKMLIPNSKVALTMVPPAAPRKRRKKSR